VVWARARAEQAGARPSGAEGCSGDGVVRPRGWRRSVLGSARRGVASVRTHACVRCVHTAAASCCCCCAGGRGETWGAWCRGPGRARADGREDRAAGARERAEQRGRRGRARGAGEERERERERKEKKRERKWEKKRKRKRRGEKKGKRREGEICGDPAGGDSDAGRARAAVAAAAAVRRDARVEGKTGFWIRVPGLWGFGRSGGTGKIPETGVRVWDLELNDEAEF